MSSIQDFYRARQIRVAHGEGPEAYPTFRLRVKTALKMIGESPQRILDYGCSVGAAARIFTEAGHEVVGVDISSSAIAVARASVSTATFETIDSESQLPFPDESFDVCFCGETVEHLFDVRGFIREVHRVLVKNGLFLLTTPYHGWFKNLLIITFNFEKHFAPTESHIRYFSKRSLTECLEAGRFRVECIRGAGRFWPIWKSMFVKARKGV